MKKSSVIILISSFFLTACDLGLPRMFVDYDHLPEGEIKEYITDTFPNKPKKEALSKMVSSHLNSDHSPENIQNVVSKMGMTCHAIKDFCEYSGYIRTKVTRVSLGSGRAKHIYRVIISPKQGVDSLNIEKQIVQDTEKVN
ncbi:MULTISPECIES: hypothetical protein [unclassified Neisseria]|jgi:hypothetical protein|nr:hypothetical protein HMPREF2954_10950 [Neisseria sp. HMSC067H09]